MSKTPKKIYAASSSATSSCRLFKSVADSANCEIFVWENKSYVARCRGRDLRQFPSEE